MKKELTLGSLFDGAGTFPLAASMCGIKALWASEVEPFPIIVTKNRFPNMKHLGDISCIKGDEIEPVDIITFSSPCQDLSIAGKRGGLGCKRSSLFYEAIRIIREMRESTNGKYPRFVVWENVTGAFSTNKGEDFRCILEEICKIKDKTFHVPRCKKWTKAGYIVGDSFDVTWRVLDAQFFGVPQRRRRIFLVADFNGECSKDILFEQECMPWDIKACSFKRENTTYAIKESTRDTIVLNDHGGQRMDVCEDKMATLRANSTRAIVYENHGQDLRYKEQKEVMPSICTRRDNQSYVVDTKAIKNKFL